VVALLVIEGVRLRAQASHKIVAYALGLDASGQRTYVRHMAYREAVEDKSIPRAWRELAEETLAASIAGGIGRSVLWERGEIATEDLDRDWLLLSAGRVVCVAGLVRGDRQRLLRGHAQFLEECGVPEPLDPAHARAWFLARFGRPPETWLDRTARYSDETVAAIESADADIDRRVARLGATVPPRSVR